MGLLDFIRDEYRKAKKSYGLLSGIPKTFKNNPRNAETMDAIFGLGGIVPGIGDAVSAAEAKYRYDQGDMLGAGLAGVGALPVVPSLAGIIKNKKMHDAALDYFGKTTNPKETGYILDDGTRLDLSGRHYATGYEKTKTGQYRPIAGQPDYLANSRNVDHRELVDLGDKIGEDLDMYKFIDQTGAVRYMPDFGVSVLDTNMPSRAQVETFVRDFRRAGNPLSVDVDSFKTGGNVASQDFARPTVDEVYNFIQKYQKGDGPAMSTGRPRNHLGQEIPPTKYELAHAEAQRVAALPVEQGGLGLPPDNTYIDRAKAMGSDTDSYHGTTKSFSEFDPMKRGTASDSGWYGDADYSTPSTEFANAFAVPNGATIPQEGANVMPLKINLGNTYKWRDLADDNGRGLWQNDRNSSIEMRRKLQQEGYDSTTVENSTIKLGENENLTQEQWNALVNKSPIVGMLGKEKIEGLMRNGYDFDTFAKSYGYDVARKMPAQKTVSEYGIFDPKNIRSRFAAFNPAKRDSADLLAGIAPWAMPIGATLLGGSFLLPPEEY